MAIKLVSPRRMLGGAALVCLRRGLGPGRLQHLDLALCRDQPRAESRIGKNDRKIGTYVRTPIGMKCCGSRVGGRPEHPRLPGGVVSTEGEHAGKIESLPRRS